ncbi:MAG: hypothetical protein BWX70_03202 [Verrucomicrobia bacterium ADurb.Bin070]|nr:MAG: hypothetical protein BWX70_03202 [Verrucomicrobia bacterium ADurb.Bin070]
MVGGGHQHLRGDVQFDHVSGGAGAGLHVGLALRPQMRLHRLDPAAGDRLLSTVLPQIESHLRLRVSRTALQSRVPPVREPGLQSVHGGARGGRGLFARAGGLCRDRCRYQCVHRGGLSADDRVLRVRRHRSRDLERRGTGGGAAGRRTVDPCAAGGRQRRRCRGRGRGGRRSRQAPHDRRRVRFLSPGDLGRADRGAGGVPDLLHQRSVRDPALHDHPRRARGRPQPLAQCAAGHRHRRDFLQHRHRLVHLLPVPS